MSARGALVECDHQTLKVTPAMAAGVTDKLWEIGDMSPWSRHASPISSDLAWKEDGEDIPEPLSLEDLMATMVQLRSLEIHT